MNKLVIAEKPMLARDIARAICGKEVPFTARSVESSSRVTSKRRYRLA